MFRVKINDELSLELISVFRSQALFTLIQQQQHYLSEWLAWPKTTTSIQIYDQFVVDSLHQYADGKAMVCTIIYNGEAVGCIGFNRIDHHLKKAMIGYWLSQNAQGKGIMTLCCHALIDWAFNKLELEKVEINVSEGNQPSRAVCERLGLVIEGVITNAENINGRLTSHVCYAMAKSQWQKHA